MEKARQLYFLKDYNKAAALIEKEYSTKDEFPAFLEKLSYVELTEIADNFVFYILYFVIGNGKRDIYG